MGNEGNLSISYHLMMFNQSDNMAMNEQFRKMDKMDGLCFPRPVEYILNMSKETIHSRV